MPQKLMDVLRLGRCSHEFSWPRRSADGHYYQVCLLCAVEYKYDWKTMRRVERGDPAAPHSATTPPAPRHTPKTTKVSPSPPLKLEPSAPFQGTKNSMS